jgi:hypothetical protein
MRHAVALAAIAGVALAGFVFLWLLRLQAQVVAALQ